MLPTILFFLDFLEPIIKLTHGQFHCVARLSKCFLDKFLLELTTSVSAFPIKINEITEMHPTSFFIRESILSRIHNSIEMTHLDCLGQKPNVSIKMSERVLLSLITTLGTYRENVVLRRLYNETSGNFRVVDYFEILHIHLN